MGLPLPEASNSGLESLIYKLEDAVSLQGKSSTTQEIQCQDDREFSWSPLELHSNEETPGIVLTTLARPVEAQGASQSPNSQRKSSIETFSHPIPAEVDEGSELSPPSPSTEDLQALATVERVSRSTQHDTLNATMNEPRGEPFPGSNYHSGHPISNLPLAAQQTHTSPSRPYDTTLPQSTTLVVSQPKHRDKVIRPCYILIALGICTILGSLIAALWRSIDHDDISGGFSLAQYILGIGVFVVGSVVVVHSKTCTCWQ